MEPSQSYHHIFNQTVISVSRAFDAAKLHLCRVKLRIAQTDYDYELALQAYDLARENFDSKAEELKPFEHVADDCYHWMREAQYEHDEILSNLGSESHSIGQAKLDEIKQASDYLKHTKVLYDEALEALKAAEIAIPLNELREEVRKTGQVCKAAECKRDEAKAELAAAKEKVASTYKAFAEVKCAQCW